MAASDIPSPAAAAAAAASGLLQPLHPYYPLGTAIPSYAANTMATLEILAYFALGCGAILVATRLLALRSRPSMGAAEQATAMWFALSGCIHLGMEGYVVWYAPTVASQSTLLAQAWKEYSLSDSRYLTQDPFVITMEAITAVFWGPLCLFLAYAVVADHRIRHPLTVVVSLGQIYGDVLYYATCAYNHVVYGVIFCRPESFYFWAYFILLNAFWIVIPGYLMAGSLAECGKAFEVAKAVKVGKKAN